ncbi:MAG: site-specific integrase, partial [Rickettsiella sp.]|nr:site-specific integrase [Rickettsiella sp.]
RVPYPLDRKEETRLFDQLPSHLQQMALFAVNSGCRDQEICQLKWDWEIYVPELKVSVFNIPAIHVKNRHDRLVILNDIAQSVINARRGLHPVFVFTYRNKALTRMSNSAWRRARLKVGLPQVRIHDLKHTFGRRLRAANVSFEDRQDLLGHKSQRVTTHYSSAELGNLIEAANKVCLHTNNTPVLSLLRKRECPVR